MLTSGQLTQLNQTGGFPSYETYLFYFDLVVRGDQAGLARERLESDRIAMRITHETYLELYDWKFRQVAMADVFEPEPEAPVIATVVKPPPAPRPESEVIHLFDPFFEPSPEQERTENLHHLEDGGVLNTSPFPETGVTGPLPAVTTPAGGGGFKFPSLGGQTGLIVLAVGIGVLVLGRKKR